MIDTIGYACRLIARYWPLSLVVLALLALAYLWLSPAHMAPPGPLHTWSSIALGALIVLTIMPAWRGAVHLSEVTREFTGPARMQLDPIVHCSVELDGGIRVDISRPGIGPASANTCAEAFSEPLSPELGPIRPAQPLRIILYAPGWGNARAENADFRAALASAGYIVVSIDDIAKDAPYANAEDERIRTSTIDLSSAEAVAQTRANTDRRVALEAQKAIAALDALQACIPARWRERIDFNRVGFLGFSFGGATAAQAATMDPRFRAIVNLDGSRFGQAAAQPPAAPYLTLLADFELPSARRDASSRRHEFAFAREMALLEAERAAAHDDTYAFLVRGALHEAFTDEYGDQSNARKWLMLSPGRARAIRLYYTLHFFNRYLHDARTSLLDRASPPYAEVITSNEIASAVRNATAP
ncbi:dienelactone hydrolase family protein [Vitreimonas flagellata]|uniref:alpha/beta hydrolase n=1 Tax=Vitreimonas flagellata TaxID=2560861 RepID=UPI001074EE88|nr:dienelactone hydrolase family protein [Vitreimonas flagellata]